ncbi:MAG: PIN domain-containing protein [Defluviitaleaceae bacterium]|nr:PIN domain-containing protein [Defluviitaleaceae bacterium]
MRDNAFIDTNVFLYLYSEDEYEKRAVGIAAMKKYDCITSTQAINELCNVFTKKWRLPITEINKALQEIKQACNIKLIDMGTVNYALNIHQEYGYSYYDCLMLASALMNGSKYILTEDMQDGHIVDGLEIVNIFKS